MGGAYDIKVFLPEGEPPERGFPVYYLLDGNAYFQFGRDVVKLQSKNAPKTLVSQAIVIGIGHTGVEEEGGKRRFYDFTPPAEQYLYPERLKGADLGMHGGAEKFFAFIEQELMPVISKKYPVDVERQTLFGHSLGGLFVLWALFTQPKLFQTYVASSPSIWWNDHEVLLYADHNHYIEQRLLITVGSEERFMVEDAKRLYAMLNRQSLKELAIELYVAMDENHASVVPTIMSRAFRFANR